MNNKVVLTIVITVSILLIYTCSVVIPDNSSTPIPALSPEDQVKEVNLRMAFCKDLSKYLDGKMKEEWEKSQKSYEKYYRERYASCKKISRHVSSEELQSIMGVSKCSFLKRNPISSGYVQFSPPYSSSKCSKLLKEGYWTEEWRKYVK